MHAATAPLAELRLRDEDVFGGKSAALGELLSGGIPVPGGFAISATAFLSFVDGAGLRKSIGRALTDVDVDDLEAVQRVSAALTTSVVGAELPEPLRAELIRRYAELDPSVVRVDADRSADDVARQVLAEASRAL